jgi:hypothetical protein
MNRRKRSNEEGDILGPLLITLMIVVLVLITLPK